MTVGNKVRIYDLAKELKLETKRLIEEVRREGFDVSVPSNTVPKELADKIRNRYFPKKEAAPPRTIRVVKKAPRPAEEGGEEIHASVPPTATDGGAAIVPVEEPAEDVGTTKSGGTVRLFKKPLAPAARAEHPGASVTGARPAPSLAELSYPSPQVSEPPTDLPGPVEASAQAAPLVEQTGEAPLVPVPPTAVPEVEPKPAPPAKQIRMLRPTAAALDAGIRPGERAPAPKPTTPSPRERERQGREGRGGRSGRRDGARQTVEFTGTPGESATPQTLYTPPADARRRPTRSTRRGGAAPAAREGFRGRGRFDRDYIAPPKALSLEQRIASTIGGGAASSTAVSELKPVRLVEGSTVKEFAEKLGVKPKDIVALLLQRGVFATINQALNAEMAQ